MTNRALTSGWCHNEAVRQLAVTLCRQKGLPVDFLSFRMKRSTTCTADPQASVVRTTTRQRRPDMPLYVPRGRKLEKPSSGQERYASSNVVAKSGPKKGHEEVVCPKPIKTKIQVKDPEESLPEDDQHAVTEGTIENLQEFVISDLPSGTSEYQKNEIVDVLPELSKTEGTCSELVCCPTELSCDDSVRLSTDTLVSATFRCKPDDIKQQEPIQETFSEDAVNFLRHTGSDNEKSFELPLEAPCTNDISSDGAVSLQERVSLGEEQLLEPQPVVPCKSGSEFTPDKQDCQDEDSWDSLFDETGECFDPEVLKDVSLLCHQIGDRGTPRWYFFRFSDY